MHPGNEICIINTLNNSLTHIVGGMRTEVIFFPVGGGVAIFF